MTINLADLMGNALETTEALEVPEAKDILGRPGVQFVDVRDLHELQKSGKINGAVHASRGMLEFLIDPDSPYYNEAFKRGDTRYVVYCMSGGRSALAAARMQEMGYDNVCHLRGGFKAWRDADGAVEDL